MKKIMFGYEFIYLMYSEKSLCYVMFEGTIILWNYVMYHFIHFPNIYLCFFMLQITKSQEMVGVLSLETN
jgi:hypothetical protein